MIQQDAGLPACVWHTPACRGQSFLLLLLLLVVPCCCVASVLAVFPVCSEDRRILSFAAPRESSGARLSVTQNLGPTTFLAPQRSLIDTLFPFIKLPI
jgi:hypothetical protein